jgi:hypothetical protein
MTSVKCPTISEEIKDDGIIVRKIDLDCDDLRRPDAGTSSATRPPPGEFSLQNKDKYSADGLNRGPIDTKPKGFAP